MSASAYAVSPSPPFVRNFREFRREPCTVCDKTGWCRRFDDGAIECMRIESPTSCKSGGWLHWPNGQPHDWRERVAALPPRRERPALDRQTADVAYRTLFDHCPLSDEDRAGLHARGLSDTEIDGNFGTLPADAAARGRIVAAVTEAIAGDPAGVVPGFARKSGRATLVNIPGLLIAGRDGEGLLGSTQVRPNDPGDGGKYRHLSFGDGPGSVGADGNFVNVSRPQRPVSMTRVVMTEGYIKGLVIAHRLGRTTLSVPGVGNTANVVATIRALGGVEEIWMAYDRDSDTKPQVAAAETKIVRELADAGLDVKQLIWPAEYGKGLDDALTAGVVPVLIPHPALSELSREAGPGDPDVGRTLTKLQTERDAAITANRARARIQRNSHLPARPMASVVAGVFANAATASKPAGPFTDRVPAGYVLAPVRGLSEDAGTKPNNGGKQLAKLEAANLIVRRTIEEAAPPGSVDPETGEILKTPRRIVRHFIAIPEHEDEPVTPEAVRALVDRMATFDSGAREPRGGKRIPRCTKHPHAEIIREFVDVCSVCRDVLNAGEHPLPTMLLESAPAIEQTLLNRDGVPEHDDGDEEQHTESVSLGIRVNAHKSDATVPPAPIEQTLLDRDSRPVLPHMPRETQADPWDDPPARSYCRAGD